MRYYLVTTQREPGFYRADGSVVNPSLRYVEQKCIKSLSADGELIDFIVAGTSSEHLGVWMVEDIGQAVKRLESLEVYPFENKIAARTHAKRLGLRTFKYLPVPVV